MAARLPSFEICPESGAIRGKGCYEGGIPLQISTEEIGRIMQAGRLNRTSLTGPKGYGRPVEPRVSATVSNSDNSDFTQEPQRVKAIVDALPDVREDLVQSLKARIESGTYYVCGEEIADLILRRALADSMRPRAVAAAAIEATDDEDDTTQLRDGWVVT